MGELDDARGVLYPAALPAFHRRAVPDELSHLARWYWTARWDLRAGEVSSQALLPFPAANLVVQPEGITLSGPTTSASVRELTGRGWVFGVHLRAVGLATLGVAPAELLDTEVAFPGVEGLAADVARHMEDGAPEAAAGVMSAWWTAAESGAGPRREPVRGGAAPTRAAPTRAAPTRAARDLEAAALADRMVALVESEPEIVGVEQLAHRMGLSARTLQRLAGRYVGLPPLRIIRRYRLQEAALRLRQNPDLTIARVASELGYADHSHLASDFRSTLGLSASDYRQRQP